ncbi:hypothetical protein BDV19DRAFT_322196 [Aspergillus venezuelensis]
MLSSLAEFAHAIAPLNRALSMPRKTLTNTTNACPMQHTEKIWGRYTQWMLLKVRMDQDLPKTTIKGILLRSKFHEQQTGWDGSICSSSLFWYSSSGHLSLAEPIMESTEMLSGPVATTGRDPGRPHWPESRSVPLALLARAEAMRTVHFIPRIL